MDKPVDKDLAVDVEDKSSSKDTNDDEQGIKKKENEQNIEENSKTQKNKESQKRQNNEDSHKERNSRQKRSFADQEKGNNEQNAQEKTRSDKKHSSKHRTRTDRSITSDTKTDESSKSSKKRDKSRTSVSNGTAKHEDTSNRKSSRTSNGIVTNDKRDETKGKHHEHSKEERFNWTLRDNIKNAKSKTNKDGTNDPDKDKYFSQVDMLDNSSSFPTQRFVYGGEIHTVFDESQVTPTNTPFTPPPDYSWSRNSEPEKDTVDSRYYPNVKTEVQPEKEKVKSLKRKYIIIIAVWTTLLILGLTIGILVWQLATKPIANTEGESSQSSGGSFNGGYSVWSSWTECSMSCGPGGTKYRQRTCNAPPAQYGGLECVGPNEDVTTCFTECPIDGQWSSWETWTQCSLPCAGGTRTRKRLCDDPVPNSSGQPCEGFSTQFDPCNTQGCQECSRLCQTIKDGMFDHPNLPCEWYCWCAGGRFWDVTCPAGTCFSTEEEACSYDCLCLDAK